MLSCMRTTFDIQDDLLVELKKVAARENRTLKDLVEDAIRAALALRNPKRSEAPPQPVVTFRGRGVQRGVTLDSMGELLDVMERTR